MSYEKTKETALYACMQTYANSTAIRSTGTEFHFKALPLGVGKNYFGFILDQASKVSSLFFSPKSSRAASLTQYPLQCIKDTPELNVPTQHQK